MNIKKGDKVKIISGKDKGKTGTVTRAFPKKETVIVEGSGVRKRHSRPRKQGKKGQIVEINVPLSVSNVMLVDPSTGKATRIGYKIEKDKKQRIAKVSGKVI